MPAADKGKTEAEASNANASEGAPPPVDPIEPEVPTGNSKKSYVTHWSCSTLQGNDDTHSGFNFPTITSDYNNPVALSKAEFEAANVASINTCGFRLREVEV